MMVFVSHNISLPDAVAPYVKFMPYVFPVFTLAVMAAGAFIAKVLPVAHQFAKFSLVGGLNFLIDLGVLNLLIAATGITAGFGANAFKAASFLVAVTSSFIWNKFWTFRSLSVEHAAKQFAEFFAVTLVGFFINVGAFALVNGWLGPQWGIDPQTWASVAATGSAVSGLLWNFLGLKFVVFRRK